MHSVEGGHEDSPWGLHVLSSSNSVSKHAGAVRKGEESINKNHNSLDQKHSI